MDGGRGGGGAAVEEESKKTEENGVEGDVIEKAEGEEAQGCRQGRIMKKGSIVKERIE